MPEALPPNADEEGRMTELGRRGDVSRDGFVRVRKTTWRERLVLNCWPSYFPYLFKRWTVEDRNIGFCGSFARRSNAQRWIAEWDRLT